MITKQDAQKEVERRERDVELAVQAVEDAKKNLAHVTAYGDDSGRQRTWQVQGAEGWLRHARLEETRAREAHAAAQRALDAVAAHESEFDALADCARRIAEREAALVELGRVTRDRIAAEVAALQHEVAQANEIWRGLPIEVVTGVGMLGPAAWSRWASLPFARDILALLADATRDAAGGR